MLTVLLVVFPVLLFPDKDQPVCGSSGQNNLPVQERLPDCKYSQALRCCSLPRLKRRLVLRILFCMVYPLLFRLI